MLVAVGIFFDEFGCLRRFGGKADVFVGTVPAEIDVSSDCIFKQEIILEDDAEPAVKLTRVKRSYVVAVDADNPEPGS